MMKKEKTTVLTSEKPNLQDAQTGVSGADTTLSETWAQDALQDLEDFIESQGIYIRQ